MWVWCLPELIFGGVLIVIAIWVTWIVAEQTGYERGVAEWDGKPKYPRNED